MFLKCAKTNFDLNVEFQFVSVGTGSTNKQCFNKIQQQLEMPLTKCYDSELGKEYSVPIT
jgi:hypothetical protein